jgi:hypothetical protein
MRPPFVTELCVSGAGAGNDESISARGVVARLFDVAGGWVTAAACWARGFRGGVSIRFSPCLVVVARAGAVAGAAAAAAEAWGVLSSWYGWASEPSF